MRFKLSFRSTVPLTSDAPEECQELRVEERGGDKPGRGAIDRTVCRVSIHFFEATSKHLVSYADDGFCLVAGTGEA